MSGTPAPINPHRTVGSASIALLSFKQFSSQQMYSIKSERQGADLP